MSRKDDLRIIKTYKTLLDSMLALQYTLDTKSTQRIFPCTEGSMDKIDQIEKLKNGVDLGIKDFAIDSSENIFQ